MVCTTSGSRTSSSLDYTDSPLVQKFGCQSRAIGPAQELYRAAPEAEHISPAEPQSPPARELLQELLLCSAPRYVIYDCQSHEDVDKKVPEPGKLAACSVSVLQWQCRTPHFEAGQKVIDSSRRHSYLRFIELSY